jgi:SAM-dependent methyltransferase
MEYLPEILESDWRSFVSSRSTFNPTVKDLQEVECVRCPKFRRYPSRCSVPFGSRIRSCVAASTELHLRRLNGKKILEIGCGESSFARKVVEIGGGTWFGIDQALGRKDTSRFVHSIRASVPYFPFGDEAFDIVFGTQVIEHFEDPFTPGDASLEDALAAIWRVLKPGGWVYFDAPIHLHGGKDFICGNIARIRRKFDGWSNVTMLSWRRRYRPLRAHLAPIRETKKWVRALGVEEESAIEALRRKSAWILAIRAVKPLSPNGS